MQEMKVEGVFDPFFAIKPVGEGIGLGFDTVAHIVRKHYGNVRTQSKPGDTCFQGRLPLMPGGAAPSRP